MFNNLIESSSHRKEFKRRGSFFLVTTASYALMLVLTGIASIYAYDARLEEQTTELQLVTFVPLEEAKEAAPEPKNTIRPTTDSQNNTTTQSIRTVLIDSTLNPNNPPKDVGTIASSVPPARSDSVLSSKNEDFVLPTGSRGNATGEGEPRPNVELTDPPPPPPPPPPPVKKIITASKVLNSQALSLPKPNYPAMAKQIRLQGVVNVQVLIDETGRVISAKAVSGHPMLIPEATRAATQAKFSPTILGENAVKVSGVITYNFVLN